MAGAVLGTVGYSVVSLVSILQIPVVSLWCEEQNVSRHYEMSLGKQNSPWLRTPKLICGDRVGIIVMLGGWGIWRAIDQEKVHWDL